MKKTVWITLGVALVLVTLIAEALNYFAGIHVVMIVRISLVLGITMIASVFVGTSLLLGKLEQERPLSGTVRDTLGADKKEG